MARKAKLKVNYLECRDWGHSWSAYTVEKVAGTRYLVRLRCSRCDTFRSRLISRRGDLLRHNSYIYPDGYLAAPGEKITRTEVRKDLLRVLIEGGP